jgi:hypothetical protein
VHAISRGVAVDKQVFYVYVYSGFTIIYDYLILKDNEFLHIQQAYAQGMIVDSVRKICTLSVPSILGYKVQTTIGK